ncbi:MAG: hypothetical protein A3F18_08650 [Legionellales bacterium RIFCSPHIGHO2_12_FULL_37_14]|nr:MAG: hypothetical protein A3F18_08650 [Legionellales bacterium RIFCSPHIGHO2_12_FULL_37_14]
MLVNIHEAKTHFSKFVSLALEGKKVIIARNGQPLLQLVPYNEPQRKRVGGQLKGVMIIQDDFDAPLPDSLLNQFYKDHE